VFSIDSFNEFPDFESVKRLKSTLQGGCTSSFYPKRSKRVIRPGSSWVLNLGLPFTIGCLAFTTKISIPLPIWFGFGAGMAIWVLESSMAGFSTNFLVVFPRMVRINLALVSKNPGFLVGRSPGFSLWASGVSSLFLVWPLSVPGRGVHTSVEGGLCNGFSLRGCVGTPRATW